MQGISTQPVRAGNGTSRESKAAARTRGVLLVGNFLSGSTRVRSVCEELAIRLAEGGWNVRTTSSQANRVLRLADMAFSILRHRREYEVAQIDVYSGMSFLWAELAARVLKAMGKPYVLTLHGGDLPSFAKRHPQRVRRLLASAAAVTAPSNYLRSRMAPYATGLQVLPNALQLDRYRFRPRNPVEPRLMWLRAFHRIYCPQVAVQVLADLLSEAPQATMTMVGPDKGDGSLAETEALVQQLGVGGKVRILRGVAKEEVPACLDQGDIFLNLTSIDNTPITVLEAMASGLPVVTTNVGGIPYLLEDETHALLIPAGDAAAGVTAVRRLLSDHVLAARLVRQARELVESFDWGVVLPCWDELLKKCAVTPITRRAAV